MSAFQELIKSFEKSRDFVRDFYIYGFKTRNNFNKKSSRTYDNERRRVESWLSKYIATTYTSSGKNYSLAIDSNLSDTNPVYQAWKSKSFTSQDIMLHFYIFDILYNNEKLCVEDITNLILTNYDTVFDSQTVRKKLNEYVNEGLLSYIKEGKQYLYYKNISMAEYLPTIIDNVNDMIKFYHLNGPLGVIGSTILDNQNSQNNLFRLKHGFFCYSLEDEILLYIFAAINQKCITKFNVVGSKSKKEQTIIGIPLRIFISTRTGRRYLCFFHPQKKRFTMLRLDSIHKVAFGKVFPMYDYYHKKLNDNLPNVWGTSFGNSRELDYIKLTLSIDEKYEKYIITRIELEGKKGILTRIDNNIFSYEISLFDGNEMMPWIKTFIGRIISFQSNNKYLQNKFYRDMNTLFNMYLI